MSLANTQHFAIHGGSFVDVQGDFNNYNLFPVRGSETGIFQLKNEISGGAFHNSLHRQPPPRCHPGTRTAVLECILGWIKAFCQDKSVLWLHGPAGAGKSAIAQAIAECCAERKMLAASFFFSRGKPRRNTTSRLWATVAYQIAIFMPELRSGIGMAVENDPSIFLQSLDDQLQKLIIEPFNSFKGHVPQRLVIIDGLDECKCETQQRNLLASIATIINIHRVPLRFLIASRPEPHIRSSFDTPDFRHICCLISLDESLRPMRDVCVCFRNEFNKIYKKHRRTMASIPEPWPPEDVIQILVQRSGGQFIYASTVLKFVDDEDRRPSDQLNIVMNASSSSAFSELDCLYRQILSTSSDPTLVIRILGCIFTYEDTLSPLDVEALLALPEGEVSLALRRLHSVLHVPDEPTQPLYALHASLEEFIFDRNRASEYHISSPQCHAVIVHGLLCAVMEEGTQSRLYKYTAEYWHWHCSLAEAAEELFLDFRSLDDHSWSVLLPQQHPEDLGDSAGTLSRIITWLRSLFNPPEDVLQRVVDFRDRVYQQILSNDDRKILPLFLMLFEHLPVHRSAEIILGIQDDYLFNLLGYYAYGSDCKDGDKLSFSNFLRDKVRAGPYFVDPTFVHGRLACHCIELLNVEDKEGEDRLERYPQQAHEQAIGYARKYWAKHLSLASPVDKDLWNDLKRLWFSSTQDILADRSDGRLVVKWLLTSELSAERGHLGA